MKHGFPIAILALFVLLASTALLGTASAQTSPTAAVSLSPAQPVKPGTEITAAMSFNNLEEDSDTSTNDYTFRADVKDPANNDDDACEGDGVGIDRYIYRVDDDPETRTGTISADCPPGAYVVVTSISKDGSQVAQAQAELHVLPVLLALALPYSITQGQEADGEVSFSNLRPDSNPSTVEYLFRADVKDADGNDLDACEGAGMGADRDIDEAGKGAASYSFTISGDCPARDYTLEVSISSPGGVELASARFDFTVTADPPASGDDEPLYRYEAQTTDSQTSNSVTVVATSNAVDSTLVITWTDGEACSADYNAYGVSTTDQRIYDPLKLGTVASDAAKTVTKTFPSFQSLRYGVWVFCGVHETGRPVAQAALEFTDAQALIPGTYTTQPAAASVKLKEHKQGANSLVEVNWVDPLPCNKNYNIYGVDVDADDAATKFSVVNGRTIPRLEHILTDVPVADVPYERVQVFCRNNRTGRLVAEAGISSSPGTYYSSDVSRSVAENTAAGTGIGDPVTSTDAGLTAPLTHSLEGTDAASFDIDAATGQLRTRVALDHEAKSSYTVSVKVTDQHSASDTVSVAIYVTDVAEPPGKPSAPTVSAAFQQQLGVSWNAPANTGPKITDYDYRYKPETATTWTEVTDTDLSLTATTIDGLTANTTYDVQVRATNEEDTGDWSDSGQGTTLQALVTDTTNTAPVMTSPTSTEHKLLFPNGVLNTIKFADVPATDADSDALTYRFVVSIPGSEALLTPEQALFEITRKGNNFEIKPSDNVTPKEYGDLYGYRNTSSQINLTMYANDGKADSNRQLIELLFFYDPSARFSAPAVYGSKSRYTLDLETYEGPNAGPDLSIEWTGILSGSRTWATGSPATALQCRDYTGNLHDQDWPASGSTDSGLFESIARTTYGRSGSITPSFKTDPDYETPADSGADNVYHLRYYQSHDLHNPSAETTQPGCAGSAVDVRITVKDVGPPAPVMPEGSFDATNTLITLSWNAPAGFVENGDTVPFPHPSFAPTSYDYRHRLADATQWSEPAATTETPVRITEVTGNTYEVQVRATNSEGTGEWSDTVQVEPANKLPVLASGSPTTQDVPENTAADTNIGDPYTATDPDVGDTLTFSLEGPDAGFFDIDTTTGQLKTKAALDHEGKSAYSITVKVSDGNAGSDTVEVEITVTDVAEAPAFADDAPIAQSVAENTPAAAAIGSPYTATDPDDGATLTYSLEGTDSAPFDIDTGTGQLKTKDPLDHEATPSYSITVKVSDGSLSDTVNVTITVTDVDEPPRRPAAPTVQATSPTELSVTWQAPDGVGRPAISDYDYRYQEPGATGWTEITDTSITTTSATISGLTANTTYEVQVRANNDEGPGDWSDSTTQITQVQPNRPPAFAETAPTAQDVAENTPTDTNIGTSPYTATDPDAGATLTYSLEGTDAASFDIDTNGQLKTKEALDHETKSSYSITVKVSDGTLSDTVDVAINVTDLGEKPGAPAAPTLDSSTQTSLTVSWSAPTTNTGPAISDYDVQYRVGTSGSWTDVAHEGTATSATITGLTAGTQYQVQVRAYNDEQESDWSPPLTWTTQVQPNAAPTFTEGTSTTRSVAENTEAGQNVGTPVAATDTNTEDTLTYTLEGTDASSFAIVPTSGQLQTSAALDYETDSSYSVTVKVTDGQGGSDTVNVTITVTNVNEAPAFADTAPTTQDVDENTAPATGIGSPYTATDPESDALTYSLEGTDASSFDIDSNGQLKTKEDLDYEDKSSYSITINASDGTLSDTVDVTITVTNVNEAPAFPSTAPTAHNVDENTATDTDIGTSPYTATDPDAGATLTYSLEGTDAASFDIDSSGQLKTKEDLDYETKDSYTVTVKVDDGRGGSDTVDVTITVTNVNEAPAFADTAPTTQDVDENTAPATGIGSPYTATDPESDALTYSLEGTDASSFDIDSNGQLKTKEDLDYEDKSSYSITINASDGTLSDTVDVTITVTNVNEAPAFPSTAPTAHNVDENTATDTDIGTSPYTATDPDAGATLTYSLEGTDAASFDIDATGQLKTEAALNHEDKSSYSVTIKVSDGSLEDTVAVTITVTNVVEPPGKPAAPDVQATSQTVLSVSWSAPSNTGPAISDYDYRYQVPGAASWTEVTDTTITALSATISGLTANTAYEVQVRATNDEGTGGWSDSGQATTLVQPNRDPAFASNAPTAQDVPENTARDTGIGDPYTATDPDTGDTLTYSLEGTDASSFDIDSNGQLKTSAALDHEVKSSYSITVKVSDGRGGSDTVPVTITVTNVNEAPDFDTAPTTQDVDENTAAETDIGSPYTANDPDAGDTVNYSLDGTDAASFDIDSTSGQLKTNAALDHEGKSSYSITVNVSDGTLSDTVDVTINVTDVNEAPSFPSTAPTTQSVAENTPAATTIGSPYTATDPDTGDTLAYSLEGADASSFDIDSSGQLKTKAALNHEDKSSYTVTVKVSDGSLSDTVNVTITVTDVDEPPGKPAALDVQAASQTVLNVTWQAPSNTGPAISDYDYRYKESGATGWTEVTDTTITATSTTISGLTANTAYHVQVRATNDEGTGAWSDSGRATTQQQPNRAPEFPGNARTVLRVAENTPAGANIGDPYTAADPNAGDTLTYSLEGADASSFIIDSIGQLRTSAALNYEAKTSYSVTVKVSDGRGGSDTVTVTISVTDVNEPPGKPAAPTLARDESKTDLAVSWEAPENTGPPISRYDYRYRQLGATWTDRNTTNTITTITGLLEGQTYEVQMRASNAEGAGDWSDSATWSFNVPGAPENLHAFVTRVGGTDTLVVRFDPPGNEGGSDIIRYELDESFDEGVTWYEEQSGLLVSIAPREGGGLHIETLRLTSARNANQARLRYRVRAVNQQGAGPWAGPTFIGGEPGQVARPPGPPQPPADTTPPGRPTIVRFDNIQDPDFDGVLVEGQHIDLLALFMNDPVKVDKTCRDSSINVLCGTPYVVITFEADRDHAAGTSGAKARAYFHPGLYADQPDTLGFRYTIAAGDDGWLRMPANGLNANGGAITDLADNAAPDLGHTARSSEYRVDTRGPEFESASVNSSRVTVTFDERIDSTFTAYSSFTVKVNGKTRTLSGISRVRGSTVTLILAESVTAGDTVTLGYRPPTNSDPVRDRMGRPAAAFAGKPVTNETPAEPPPAPRNFSATSGDNKATLSWDPPSNNGGAAIARYEYQYEDFAETGPAGPVPAGATATARCALWRLPA